MTLLGNEARPRAMTLGGRIRLARVAADMKQSDLASHCDVSRSAIGQWENGDTEPSASRMFIIARVTGQPLDWFAAAHNETAPAVAEAVLDLRAPRDSNPQPSGWEARTPRSLVALSTSFGLDRELELLLIEAEALVAANHEVGNDREA